MEFINVTIEDTKEGTVQEQQAFIMKDGETWEEFMDRLEQEEMEQFWGRG